MAKAALTPLTRKQIDARGIACAISDEERGIALPILDAALLADPRLHGHGDGEAVKADCTNVQHVALREYLRRFPRCTDLSEDRRCLYVWRYQGEHDYTCGICRESIASLGRAAHPSAEWWERVQLHVIKCAALLVLGQIEPTRPPKHAWQYAKNDPPEPKPKRKGKRRLSAEARAAREERARQRRIARWPGWPSTPWSGPRLDEEA